ncbi:hypothetical protein ACQKEG_27655, partial [Klebsiella quasipneumoniae]
LLLSPCVMAGSDGVEHAMKMMNKSYRAALKEDAASGLVDALVNDGVNAVKTAMNEAIAKGVPAQHRSDNYDDYLRRLSQFDTRQQADTAQIKQLFAREEK